MNMTGFTANCTMTAPDPAKHVKYTLGMVLGVEDLEQEFAYHDGYLRSAIRDLHGYGTVNGLSVKIEDTTKGPRVRIDKGAAAMPSGHLVCVPMDQCAYLNDWLKIPEHKTTGPSVRLYVVLCYRCCPTDPMPIPGEPCRSEDSLTAPSRLLDDFILELRVEPPSQVEHDTLRIFVEWLTQIAVVDSGSTISKEEFMQAIRDSFSASSPPTSPPSGFMMTGPPLAVGSPPETFQIDKADLPDYLKAAGNLWITELRPHVHPLCAGPGSTSCCGHEETEQTKRDDDTCLLLAALDIPLTSEGQVASTSPVFIDEQDRPILFPTQFIQRWLAAPVEGSITSPPASMVPLSLRTIAPGAPGEAVAPLGSEVPAPGGRVISAGQFDREGKDVVPSFGELKARFIEEQFIYLLQSPTIRKDKLTTLRAMAITTPRSTVTHVVEAVEASAVTGTGLLAGTLKKALAVRVRQTNGKRPTEAFAGFTVEITEYDQ